MSQNEPVGVIHLERPAELVSVARRLRVIVDGEVAGWLRAEEALTLTAAPGNHALHVGAAGLLGRLAGSGSLAFHLGPGEVAAFRVVVHIGALKNTFHIVPVLPPHLSRTHRRWRASNPFARASASWRTRRT